MKSSLEQWWFAGQPCMIPASYSLFPVTHYFLYSLITFGIKVIMQILSSIFPFI